MFLQYARDKKLKLQQEGPQLDAVLKIYGDEFKAELEKTIEYLASETETRPGHARAGQKKTQHIRDVAVLNKVLEDWSGGVTQAQAGEAPEEGTPEEAEAAAEQPDMLDIITTRLMYDPSVGGISGIKRLKPFDARTGFNAEVAQRDHPVGSLMSVNGQRYRVSKHHPSKGVMGYEENEKNQKAERKIKHIANLVMRMLQKNNLLKEAQNNEMIVEHVVTLIGQKLQQQGRK